MLVKVVVSFKSSRGAVLGVSLIFWATALNTLAITSALSASAALSLIKLAIATTLAAVFCALSAKPPAVFKSSSAVPVAVFLASKIDATAESGSKLSRSISLPKPKAVATLRPASAAVMGASAGALSMTDCTMVVSGLTLEEPAGAFMSTVLGIPVSMLTPPRITIVPDWARLVGKKN